MKMKKVVSLLSLTLFVGSSLMAQNLNKGLVIHSTFDKDAADLSQNHFNGKLKGASISKEGIIGDGCVYFNGKDSYVEYPRNKVYFNGDYSISIWCKMVTADLWVRILDFNQDKPQVGNSVTWLIGRSHQQGTHDMWFDQWVTYKGIAVESIPDIMQQNPANAYLHYNIVPNEWAHYVITYNSKAKNPNGIVKNRKGEEVPLEGIVTLYVNGKKVEQTISALNRKMHPLWPIGWEEVALLPIHIIMDIWMILESTIEFFLQKKFKNYIH